MKDEFLIPSHKTQPPETNTTVPARSKMNDVIESHPAGDNINRLATTIQSVSQAQSSTSTVTTSDTDATATQSPQSAENAKMQIVVLTSYLGSGDGDTIDQYPATSSRMTSDLRTEVTETIVSGSDGSGSGSGISEEFSANAEKDLMQKMHFSRSHSVLMSDLGSGDKEMVEKYHTRSSITASTNPPMLSGSGESELELGIEEPFSESATETAKKQKMLLNNRLSILTSDLGFGDGEKSHQYPATSSSVTSNPRMEASTVLTTSTASPESEGTDSRSEMPEHQSESVIANKQFITFTKGK